MPIKKRQRYRPPEEAVSVNRAPEQQAPPVDAERLPSLSRQSVLRTDKNSTMRRKKKMRARYGQY